MINNDRIVPVTKADLLSVYGTMLAIGNVSYAVIKATDVDGDYSVTASGAAGIKLADQPVKTLEFGSGVTGATIYFVPAFDYAGFSKTGATITVTGTVKADGATLYKAVLASGTVTITAVTPVAE